MTGELADGWLPIWVHADHLPSLLRPIKRAAEKAGRSLGDITVAPQVLCYVADTPEQREEARRLMRAHMAYYIGGMGAYYYNLFQRYGYVEESARVRAAAQVSDEMLDGITVYGDEDECREKLARLRARGVDGHVIGFPNGCSAEAMFRTLEALAPQD